MDTDNKEGGLGKRVCRRKKRVMRKPDFVYQRRWGRESRSARKKVCHSQELFQDTRLVKIELDAAEALADFSRLAHLPLQRCPSDLKWSERRKRTPQSVLRVESRDARVVSKVYQPSSDLRTSELESTTSLSHGDKSSSLFHPQAESPSSPLPAAKVGCKDFFVSGGLPSNLSIRKDVSAAATYKSIKREMKEFESESVFVNSAAKQKSRTFKPQVPFCSVKTGVLNGQTTSESEGLQLSRATKLQVRPFGKFASQLVERKHEMDLLVVDKPKAALSEDDKEARRLRRIQANRESARQTIRKKQLFCEELRRQSASLALENDAMKQKRDMLLQELALLKGQNYHLKTQLNFRASNHLGSQCSYTMFPSHVFGWSKTMTQEVNDSPAKKERTESPPKLGGGQCRDAFGTVPGLPARSVAIHSLKKDITSTLPLGVSQEGHNNSGVAGIETGPPCDAASITTDSQWKSEVQRHNSQADCGLVGKHISSSTSRAPEHMEGHMSFDISFPVMCVSSCTANIGSIPRNGQGFVCSYPWRTTNMTPSAAAEARKKRKELTRKKRLCAKPAKSETRKC